MKNICSATIAAFTVCACVSAVSACPVRCSRGRTTAPTPVGEARTLSRGRRLLQSNPALSSGTRPSPKRRRPKSPARLLPSSLPAPRGRFAALIVFYFVFSAAWLLCLAAQVVICHLVVLLFVFGAQYSLLCCFLTFPEVISQSKEWVSNLWFPVKNNQQF